MNLSVMTDGSEQICYQNPEIPIYICYGNLRDLSNMAALCHWHEDVELLMPIKGYLSYNINGKQIFIDKGNAIFVNSRQMHFGFSADGTDCEYICICFKPELLGAHKYLYERYVMPVLNSPGLTHLLVEKENPDCKYLLEIIRDISKFNVRNLTLMGKFYELWQEIYNVANPEQEVSVDRNLQILKQMLTFIHIKYAEHMSLAQIAAAGGVCRSKCCQIFKKYMNNSPNGYVTSFRLEKSMELLRESNLSITEIANACGFGSSSYFAECFTKLKGCTPTEYRKLYK